MEFSQVVQRARELEHVEGDLQMIAQDLLRLETQQQELANKRLQLLESLQVDVVAALDAS